MKRTIACPHCGHEFSPGGPVAAATLSVSWVDIAQPQLPVLAAELADRCESIAAAHLQATDTRLIAELVPTMGPAADMASVALDAARIVAPSWPGWLADAGVRFVANVGFTTVTAGATLMESLAEGLADADWLANVLVESATP